MPSGQDMEINRKKIIAVMRLPIFFIVINFFLVNTLFSLLPSALGDILYNAGRIGIVCFAGWAVTRKNIGTLWHAGGAGAVVYFVDHVVLKGGIFLANHLLKPDGMGLTALSGVLVSFLLFSPLAMLIGAAGGRAGKARRAGTGVDQA